MKRIRNINPQGAVDLPTLGLSFGVEEVLQVEDHIAADLLLQVGNYELVEDGE